MRRNSFALGIGLLLAAASSASAQIRPDVTVNPNASGTRVLLYPGGKYGRVMHPLLEPGERDPNAPIVLHMPRKHVHRTAQAKPKPKVETAAATPAPAKQAPQEDTVPLSALPDESAAKLVMAEPAKPSQARPSQAKPKPTPPPKQVAVAKPPPAPPKQQPAPPKPAPKQVASAKPAPPKQQGLPPPPSETDAFVLSGDQSSQTAAVPPPAPAPAPPPPAQPTRTASVEPGPATELSKRNSILFTPGAEEPPPSALEAVKGMTASLTAALWSGTAHIQLEAFGGKPGDKSSDARRLSLKRALIIRQLLIDDGIPSERIVVRAMGGASDGASDRVDIFVAA
ncbi:MAG TPA: OmpA family protein [Rhizomicrobium sp.]|nr:OmpA family protein [Rhizomicrobium sp.]